MTKTTRATRRCKAKSEKRVNYKNRYGNQSKWPDKPKDSKQREKPTDSENVHAAAVGHGNTYVHCNPLPPPLSYEEVCKKYVDYLVEEQRKYNKHKHDIVNPFHLYSQYCENYEDSLKTPWVIID